MSCLGPDMPNDISERNTFWIETLQNTSGLKGFGKKLVDVVKNFALTYHPSYKYVFLYPSDGFGRNEARPFANQADLITKVYEPWGFRQIRNCDYIEKGQSKGRDNKFDNHAPYTLMFAEIRALNTEAREYANYPIISRGGDPYYQKYLKYKNKYIELKNRL
jgi:hypothetical protein